MSLSSTSSYFFFNDTATTEIYTLSLHDALPIFSSRHGRSGHRSRHHSECRYIGTDIHWVTPRRACRRTCLSLGPFVLRSEEHTSELQSQSNLVCRLLLEKKKKPNKSTHI